MNSTLTDRRPERLMTRATAAPSRTARRRAAFWLLAFVFAATMLGTTLPRCMTSTRRSGISPRLS